MADVEEIADRLYSIHPDEFAKARDEQIKKAKDEGDAALAKELGQLRRPTQSAWLINQLTRDQREQIDELVEVGEGLTKAQEQGSAQKLRELMERRREIESALLKRAPELARKAEVTVSAEMTRELQETLSAALAM